ncbi:MAG: hypothetical protein ABSH01_25835, partial [Terriglobia bacterium]
TTPLVDVRSYRYHGVASSFKFASTSSLTGLEEASPFHNIRAQLCASAPYIIAHHAYPQTPFCTRTAATPDQENLSRRLAV